MGEGDSTCFDVLSKRILPKQGGVAIVAAS
jgi:hypothetical protein